MPECQNGLPRTDPMLDRRSQLGCTGCGIKPGCHSADCKQCQPYDDPPKKPGCHDMNCKATQPMNVCPLPKSVECARVLAKTFLDTDALDICLLRRLWGINKALRKSLGELCFQRLCHLSPSVTFESRKRIVALDEIRAFFSTAKDLEESW
jgi:hypothetical protein